MEFFKGVLIVKLLQLVIVKTLLGPSKIIEYSQTSVFEHDSFWKAVQKPICSKTESYFPITNNVKVINFEVLS